ncbi:AP-4 complex subunit sigma-1 [Polyrhizophydium stewartii]|uniref:AP-4 complex subunit sigma-1 n=1 Tax=Polyrhizophydium stewartii TaxID=2732419 RepID=A0ABR4NAK6_9FUNG
MFPRDMASCVSVGALLVVSKTGRLRFARHWAPVPHDIAAAGVVGAAATGADSASSAAAGPASSLSRSVMLSDSVLLAQSASDDRHQPLPARAPPTPLQPGLAASAGSSVAAKTALERTAAALCVRQPAGVDQGSFFAGSVKVAFKRFAALSFMAVIDQSESTYAALSFIQTFVETLSRYFPSFSEYHLIFNLEKVHLVLDEMVTNGYIVETNKDVILPMFTQLERHVSLT